MCLEETGDGGNGHLLHGWRAMPILGLGSGTKEKATPSVGDLSLALSTRGHCQKSEGSNQ